MSLLATHIPDACKALVKEVRNDLIRRSHSTSGTKDRNARAKTSLSSRFPSQCSVDDTSGRGAFAEYVKKAYSDTIWKVTGGTYSSEEVAATGVP